MRVGDLFSGIGGFSLAAHWMGWSTAWFSEIDPFASRVLAHHWPDVPNHGDITQIDWTNVEPVDVLTGGFPCQPHSLAGKRKGSADERDLFDEIIRAASVLRPRYLVLENVPGLFTSDDGRFFGRVLGSLATLGYDAEWRVLSAADVGAPHRRERVWILANAQCGGWRQSGRAAHEIGQSLRAAVGRESAPGIGSSGAAMDDVHGGRRQQRDESERCAAIAGTRHAPVEHAESGGRRAGAEQPTRRADGERAGLGDALREGESQLRGLLTDERRRDRHASAIVGDASSTRGAIGLSGSHARDEGIASVGDDGSDVLDWRHAVAVRGADNTVRLIPRDAAESGPQSALWPVAHGIPARVAQLRGIGNSIVPQCALEIFRSIEAREVKVAA